MEQNTRQILLRAFSISNDQLTRSSSNILKLLKEKLSDSLAQDRLLSLKKLEPCSKDLLSDFSIQDKYIFGVMFRLAPTKEMRSVPDDLFSHPKIQITEITNEDVKTGLTCKDHYYFLMNNSFFVTNLDLGKTIKGFQTYMNWLLEVLRGDSFFDFNPMIVKNKIRLSDLKRMTINTKEAVKKKKFVERDVNTNKVINLAKDTILDMFGSISNLDNIIEKNIVSAKLIVSFEKPKNMTEVDYEKALSAYFKPIADADSVLLNTKDGKKVTGAEMQLTRPVEVDLLEDGGINEETLMQEMRRFLDALKNG